MAYIRLYYFSDRVIPLTYGLPLLVCLWYRSKGLLWAMSGTFVAMATYKAFVLLPPASVVELTRPMHWAMQVANILLIAGTVHAILRLTQQLQAQNDQLRQVNGELVAREEEISRQNEALQAQAEELSQQNEEIHQQAAELQVQTEDLQIANVELDKREELLLGLLGSLKAQGTERELLEGICRSLLDLYREPALSAAVTERAGAELIVLAQAGTPGLAEERCPYERSMATVVRALDQAAYVDDLDARPDLRVLRSRGQPFQSVLAAPLRLKGQTVGTIEILSISPRHWTTEQSRILEWLAAQSSLVLEVKRLQAELSSAKERLEEVVKTRTSELQMLVDDLEHFSYTITHDMRAPLRAMQGFAAILNDEVADSLNAEQRDYLKRIVSAAHRMDQLIIDALSYSRAVRQEMPLARLDPKALLEGMIRSYPMFQPPWAEIKIVEPFPLVLGNEAGLTQCFSNLLGNAVKFVPPGVKPKVNIRAELRDATVRIWIEDHGIGIPPEMKQRIFGMFQRASKNYEGTGIGLALVKKVAERMEGQVGVESQEGHGSRFWLELKAVEEN